jgi:hypothetical protein
MNSIANILRTDVDDLPEVFQPFVVLLNVFAMVCQAITFSESKTGGVVKVSMIAGFGSLLISAFLHLASAAAIAG